ncbi:MAG: aspartate ammonia-lyase [Chitinivibrionales bacterium]
MSTADQFRIENDLLGQKQVPENALWGIHAARAKENFPIAGRPIHPELIKAFGAVKLACFRTNRSLGVWTDNKKAEAIEAACTELMNGGLVDQVIVDALQGGAGTSTNMNVNEVIANRALVLLGKKPGDYSSVSPINDINRHQSTNDTFPTALRLACITRVHALEQSLVALQEACQSKEKEFAHIVKIGRTELQDAVLITLGREIGAWAEAWNRDRWRVYKCEERLRVVNLGGTAVGTGLGAPREYIFRVVDELRGITGIGFARAENLVDATQNADVFVEVSGILKACAASLYKISNDIRLLSSGPSGGFGELRLRPLQAGSSIMPGKVNPVIPEAICQAALLVFGHDAAITMAAASGNLELNHLMPLIAHCLLESIDVLTNACGALATKCIATMIADEKRCSRSIESATATITALVPAIGYENAAMIAEKARVAGVSIRQAACAEGLLTEAEFDALVTPEAVCRLGSPHVNKGDTAHAENAE